MIQARARLSFKADRLRRQGAKTVILRTSTRREARRCLHPYAKRVRHRRSRTPQQHRRQESEDLDTLAQGLTITCQPPSDDEYDEDYDITLTPMPTTAAKRFEVPEPRAEFVKEWSYKSAAAMAKCGPRSSSSDCWDEDESSGEDFFGIMADPLPALPPSPAAMGLPPVFTEYDPASGRWQVFSGKTSFWVADDSVEPAADKAVTPSRSARNTKRRTTNMRLSLLTKLTVGGVDESTTSCTSAPDHIATSGAASPDLPSSPVMSDSISSVVSATSSPGALRDLFLPSSESWRRFSMPGQLRMWAAAPKLSYEPRPRKRFIDKFSVIPPQPASIADLDFTYATLAAQGPLFTV